MAKNRGAFLWDYLHSGLQLNEWDTLYSDEFFALSYFARKQQSQKKIVNFVTNLPLEETEEIIVERYSKKEKEMIDVSVPHIIQTYNNTHNYVDSLKHIIANTRNTLRARKQWRVKLNAWLNLLLANSFIYHRHLHVINRNDNTISAKRSFREFITSLVQQIVSLKPTPISSPPNQIIIHDLPVAKTTNRCKVCGKHTRRYCSICIGNPFLHPNECSTRYHNQNKEFPAS